MFSATNRPPVFCLINVTVAVDFVGRMDASSNASGVDGGSCDGGCAATPMAKASHATAIVPVFMQKARLASVIDASSIVSAAELYDEQGHFTTSYRWPPARS
jgi:hypothetical protein